MIRQILRPIVLNFWASPHESMAAMASCGALRSGRQGLAAKLKVTVPDILGGVSPEIPQPDTLPEFPTDVPAPEPHDVPVPEPMDPPLPDPGDVPPPAEAEPEHKPKPRSAP
jgi:hypothetical protein